MDYSCQEEYDAAMEAGAQYEAEMESLEAEAAAAEAEQESWCCNEPPDEAGLCPVCREHIN